MPRRTPTITVSAAAIAAGLDRKTLAARLSAAREEPDSKGRYKLAQVLRALTTGMQGEKQAKLVAERKLAELNLELRRGELIPYRWAVGIMKCSHVEARTRFMALPDRLRSRFSLWQDQGQFADELEASIREILNEFSETKPTLEQLREISGEPNYHDDEPNDAPSDNRHHAALERSTATDAGVPAKL